MEKWTFESKAQSANTHPNRINKSLSPIYNIYNQASNTLGQDHVLSYPPKKDK